jgi:hypothetical protein
MALLTFGPTARANDAFAIQNTSTAFPSSSLVFALLRSATLSPGHFKFLTFNYFDQLTDGGNWHHNMLYSVGSDGVKPYLNDIAELCKLIRDGDITIYSATQFVSGGAFLASTQVSANVDGFTLGKPFTAPTVLGDGSVSFA